MSGSSVDASLSRAVLPLERGHSWNPRCGELSRLFWPLGPVLAFFEQYADWPDVSVVDEALSPRAGIHFQEQAPRPRRRRRGRRVPIETEALYDARIQLFGWVPTRQRNWHDFLNALVWATFPVAKRAFHARQHAAVAARIDAGAKVLPGARTREMDGLAILDEGGLLLLVNESRELETTQWIADRNWSALKDAIANGDAVALLFGHALYETLLGANASSTWAMVTILPCPGRLPTEDAARIQLADERLAEHLAVPGSFTNPDTFRNLPLDAQLLRP